MKTYLSKIFVKYIDKLIGLLNEDYCIVVKPHPKEDLKYYNKYNNLRNIKVTQISTEILLSKADIHITMYSTTAFDALRYGLSTYFIYNENQFDYIDEINKVIGGKIIYDFNVKPWIIENKLSVSSDEFFNQK